jgi:hypothetical protein
MKYDDDSHVGSSARIVGTRRRRREGTNLTHNKLQRPKYNKPPVQGFARIKYLHIT